MFCRKLILRTFCNGASKQSLTSKPSLTIALKFLKTIEKHWHQWLGPQKTFNDDVQYIQNHWKTIEVNDGLRKNINHSIALKNWPSLWSNEGQEERMMFQVTRQLMKSLQVGSNSGLVPGLMTWPSKMNTRWTVWFSVKDGFEDLSRQGYLHFHVANPTLPWHRLFRVMEEVNLLNSNKIRFQKICFRPKQRSVKASSTQSAKQL